MERFTITARLNAKEYGKVMWAGTYRKPLYIIAACFGLLLSLSSILEYAVPDPESQFNSSGFFCGLFLLIAPALIVRISVKQFKSNPSFSKPITYTFDEKGYTAIGETFKTEIVWEHILKAKEIGNFLILYHTKKAGNFIDKRKLSADQLEFIKRKANQSK